MEKIKVLIPMTCGKVSPQLAKYLTEQEEYEVHGLIINVRETADSVKEIKESHKPYIKKAHGINLKHLEKLNGYSEYPITVLTLNGYAKENGFDAIALPATRGTSDLTKLKKLRKVIALGDEPVEMLTPFKHIDYRQILSL